MKYLRLSLLLLAANLAYTPAQLFANPEPSTTTYQLPTQRLFQAVLNKDALAIEDLLSQGANINAQNEDGDRPIDIAYNQGDFYLVSLLKNHGADVQKERIGELPQEFKAPPIFEIFFEKSKLKQECIAMLEDTKKAFDQFKRTTQAPEYYRKMDDKEKFYLVFEHATVQKKYPLVYLLLRKQINVLLDHKSWKPMNKSIKLGMIFSSHEKNLIYHNAHAARGTNTILFGWVYLYNYITNFYTPYTIWHTLAHEWQHLYQLDYSTEIEAANKEVPIEQEIDADFLASKTSLLHTDDVATYAYIKGSFITRIYAYLSSKTAYSPTVLVKLSNHILKTITNLDPHFLNSNLNFIETSLIKLIDKAHMYASKKPSSEYPQYMIQFILDNYQNKIQKPYIQEQQDFTSTHPSDKARNKNTLKVRCLYEILLLKKYYGTQASVTISPQNAPYLHALITKDLAIAAIEDKSQNQPATDLPQQENSTPPLNPYHDFTYTIQLSDYTDAQQLIPFISEKNDPNTPNDTHNQKFFTITFPESFFIFALCNPQPHKVFSSTIIDARKKTSSLSNESNTSDLPKNQIYPFNKDALTVFEQLYNQSLSPTLQSTNPFLHHEKAIILFAQVAHILPELAPHLVDATTKEKIAAALEYITTTIFSIPEENNINNISLLSSRKKSEDIVNKVSLTLFAFIADLNNTIELITITAKINDELIAAAENLEYHTLIEKIFSIFFGTKKISLLDTIIKFNLKKTFSKYIEKYQNKDTALLHKVVKSNKPDFIQLIIEKNIAINSQDSLGNTPLYYANTYQIAQLLLSHGADTHINTKNNDGDTALHRAIQNGKGRHAQLLLQHGANPNIPNNQNNTPLHIALNQTKSSKKDHPKIIQLLLNQETINPDIANNNGETPLQIAISRREDNSIIDMILKKTNINAQDSEGNTLLHRAINSYNPYYESIIPLLLNQEAINPDIANNNSETPLHIAIFRKKDNSIINMILEKTNINAQDSEGNTLLHRAVNSHSPGYESIIPLLLNQEAINPDIANNNGETPLHIAISRGKNNSIIDIILEKTKNINAQDSEGNTLLHKAINSYNPNYESIIALLLNQETINPDIANNNGETPLEIAISKRKDNSIINMILKKTNINAQDSEGNTLLHRASNSYTYASDSIIRLLLNQETINPDIANSNSEIPLHIAISSGKDTSIINLIIEKTKNINAQDIEGNTPLHRAIQSKFTIIEEIQLLLQHNANTSIKNNHGITPEDLAYDRYDNMNLQKILNLLNKQI